MECIRKNKRFILKLIVFSLTLVCFRSWSAETIPLHSPPPPAEGFLLYKNNPKEKDETIQILNKQDNPVSDMDSKNKNYESGKSRAQQMVIMLQNEELTKAFQKITNYGNKTLEENPEIKNPLGVIAGAASFWFGRTLNLIRGDQINISAKMEGRNQRSEFSMASPLLDGKFKYDPRDGFGLGINRNLIEINTEAGIQYNAKNNLLSTELRKKIAPHLDLSFGASKMDQNTKIEYRLNF
jgi:hypothetical protein